MRRELTVGLVLGCCVILFLEAPRVLEDLGRDLAGPHAAWPDVVVDARPPGPVEETLSQRSEPDPRARETLERSLLASGTSR